jgi:hypothetical protein
VVALCDCPMGGCLSPRACWAYPKASPAYARNALDPLGKIPLRPFPLCYRVEEEASLLATRSATLASQNRGDVGSGLPWHKRVGQTLAWKRRPWR